MYLNFNRTLPWVMLLPFWLSGCDQPPPQRPEAALLSQIPADARVVFALTRPLPEPLMERILSYFSAQFEDTAQRIRQRPTVLGGADDHTAEHPLLLALVEEFSGNLTPSGVRVLGFKLDARGALYERDGRPVLRFEIADPAAIRALIDRVAARLERAFEWRQAGERAYLPLSTDDLTLVLIVDDDELIIAVPKQGEQPQQVVSLLGASPPAPSLADDSTWQRMIEVNGFTGHAQGFLDLHGVLSDLLAPRRPREVGPGVQPDALSGAEVVSSACRRLVEATLESVPRIVTGTLEVGSNRLATRTKIELSEPVAAALQTLGSPMPGVKRDNATLLRFGMSVNIPALQSLLQRFGGYLSTQGAGCRRVDTLQIQQSLLAMNMLIGPFMNGFKGVYLELDELAFNDAAVTPSRLNARLVAVVEDPQALFSLAKMMLPAFASLRLPDNGRPLPLPSEVLPPGFPTVTLAARGKMLGVSVGQGQLGRLTTLLSSPLEEKSPLMWLSYDLGRIGRALAPVAQSPRVAGRNGQSSGGEELARQLRLWGRLGGTNETVLTASDTGLVIDQVMELQ